MNHLQFGLFLSYLFSLWIAGLGFYRFMNPHHENDINRLVYLGETLLLGAILVVGEMMVLALAGYYKAGYLWGAVLLNCFLLFNASSSKHGV